ncbi:hypothetical protein Nepgr_001547 [Nepenthes gracilis]|uniref:Uncharacterized protein n=1 Tax=Nepenthes gracilis TaxID=150966 RepID=A0AAD3P7C0_NEPGR|nr:hypothetical protein Nepgr_001547 [Nepenthes gracilis]
MVADDDGKNREFRCYRIGWIRVSNPNHTRTDSFDFLVDIVPREDLKDDVLSAAIPRGTVPVAGPVDAISFYYMPVQNSLQAGMVGMMMATLVMGRPSHPYMAPGMWPKTPPQRQHSSSDALVHNEELKPYFIYRLVFFFFPVSFLVKGQVGQRHESMALNFLRWFIIEALRFEFLAKSHQKWLLRSAEMQVCW